MVRQPRHGRTADTAATMLCCDAQVEQRAADVEIIEIERTDQTDPLGVARTQNDSMSSPARVTCAAWSRRGRETRGMATRSMSGT